MAVHLKIFVKILDRQWKENQKLASLLSNRRLETVSLIFEMKNSSCVLLYSFFDVNLQSAFDGMVFNWNGNYRTKNERSKSDFNYRVNLNEAIEKGAELKSCGKGLS